MKKFEYKIYNGPTSIHIEDFTKILNQLGSEGWELCAMAGTAHIFKRELKP